MAGQLGGEKCCLRGMALPKASGRPDGHWGLLRSRAIVGWSQGTGSEEGGTTIYRENCHLRENKTSTRRYYEMTRGNHLAQTPSKEISAHPRSPSYSLASPFHIGVMASPSKSQRGNGSPAYPPKTRQTASSSASPSSSSSPFGPVLPNKTGKPGDRPLGCQSSGHPSHPMPSSLEDGRSAS